MVTAKVGEEGSKVNWSLPFIYKLTNWSTILLLRIPKIYPFSDELVKIHGIVSKLVPWINLDKTIQWCSSARSDYRILFKKVWYHRAIKKKRDIFIKLQRWISCIITAREMYISLEATNLYSIIITKCWKREITNINGNDFSRKHSW